MSDEAPKLNGQESASVDALEDVPEWARPIAAKYGRSMFALVLNAGMAQQAAAVLNEIVGKHHSAHGQRAIRVLADTFNQVSNSYVEQMGWDAETLAQCDRDCQLAFSQSIQVATPAILLEH